MNQLKNLASLLPGRVLLPGDDGFDAARRPWNLAVDQPVAAVVEAAGAEDVAAVVRHARAAGLAVTPQAGGHGATGAAEGTVLLRTSRLDEVRVDPERRLARVGAGVNWGRAQAASAPHRLTGLPGSSPVVSVTGYTLGGGLSWFGRAHGWAADSVTAFEVVTADGSRARVHAGAEPELFWALRGGGGDFAVVTAVEYALHPLPGLYGGRMLWPAARAGEVLAAFTGITATAPAELTLWLELLRFPGAPPTVAVDLTHLGGEAEARRLLRPLEELGGLVSDSRKPLALTELPDITAEPTDPGPGRSRTELVTELDEAAAEALTGDSLEPLLSVQVRHLGGALAGPSDSPHGPLTERYCVYMFGVQSSAEAGRAIGARQDRLAADLGDRVTGRKPFTMLAAGEDASAAFAPAALERLRRIKGAVDPEGVLRSSYPVRP